MVASGRMHPEVVKLLIDNGADVNARDGDGDTALMWAVIKDYSQEAVEIVEFLITHGVDVNNKNEYGETVLMKALSNEYNSKVVKLLIEAGAKE